MTTGENDMNSNQISRLRKAVWNAVEAMTEVCNCLNRIEEETRYFESLQAKAGLASPNSKEDNNV